MSWQDEDITKAYSANAEFWITIIREGRDKYQTDVVDPALWDAVGSCEGKDFLDVGCGEGYFSRQLATHGARSVCAVDSCEELVQAARLHPDAYTEVVQYYVADAGDLPIPNNSIDVIISNRLPHGLEDPARRFHEFARVLRPGGLILLLTLHPCFYRAREQEEKSLNSCSYFSPRLVVQHFEVDGLVSPQPSVQRFFSLEEYTGFIFGAGLHISGLSEPRPSRQLSEEDPWWREHATRPTFLLLQCKKSA